MKNKATLIYLLNVLGTLINHTHLRQSFIKINLDLSSRTIIDWFSFIRPDYTNDATRNSTKIGGPGIVVEIDKAKFGKTNIYNHGCWIKENQVWEIKRGS